MPVIVKVTPVNRTHDLRSPKRNHYTTDACLVGCYYSISIHSSGRFSHLAIVRCIMFAASCENKKIEHHFCRVADYSQSYLDAEIMC